MSKLLTMIAPCFYPDKSKADRLARTAKRVGIDLILFHQMDKMPQWSTVGSDTRAHFEFAPEVIRGLDSELVLFTDASDTFVLAPAEEIRDKYRDMAYNSLILAAEPGLYPPRLHEEYVAKLPSRDSPWHFPNGGGWVGPPDILLQVLEYLRTHFTESEEAQYRWARGVISDDLPIVLDEQCRIFQTMSGGLGDAIHCVEDRVVNSITNSYPCLIHFNGRLGGIDTMMETLHL